MNGWIVFIVLLSALVAFLSYAVEFSKGEEGSASDRLRATGSAIHAVLSMLIYMLVFMGVSRIWTDEFAREWGIYLVYGITAAACSYYWGGLFFRVGLQKNIPVIGRALFAFQQTSIRRRLDRVRNEAQRLEEMATRLSMA